MKRKNQLKNLGMKPDKKGDYHLENLTITRKEIIFSNSGNWENLIRQIKLKRTELAIKATNNINEKHLSLLS